jgi:hypothetical protein
LKEVVIRILVDDHATTDDIGESLYRIIGKRQTLEKYLTISDESFLDGDDKMLLKLQSATKACCEVFNIDEKDLLGRKRSKEFTVPRHLMYYIGTQKIGLSFTQTGRYFNKDHTSIMHGTKVAEVRLSEDKGFRKNLKRVLELAEEIQKTQLLAMKESSERLRVIQSRGEGGENKLSNPRPVVKTRPTPVTGRSYEFNPRIPVTRKDASGNVIDSK